MTTLTTPERTHRGGRRLLGLRRVPGRLALWVFRFPLRLYRRGWGWMLGRTFLLFEHVGRRTGTRHQAVAMVLGDDASTGDVVICSGWGPDVDWVRNLRVGPPTQVQIGRDRFVPTHRFLTDDEAVAVVRSFRARHRGRVRLVSTILGWGDLRTEASIRSFVEHHPFVAFRAPHGTGTERTVKAAAMQEVDGWVASGFEGVRTAFADNFVERGELGGAVCVVVDGEVVVDLWGGVRDRATGAPWLADTMTLVHSTTKGLSGLVMALLHSRGLIDYDDRVAAYWPEFAQNGKADITLRQLLSHQAGLFAFDEHVDAEVVADLDRLAAVMARQRPIWPPGERQAYHAITLGFYENELVRRVDPAHRTIGQVLEADIAAPLGVAGEVYIGTPSSVPDDRLAALVPPSLRAQLSMPPRLMFEAFWPRSVLHRSLVSNPGTGFYVDPDHVIVREIEVPSGGAVATARALAKAYGAFASAGGPLGLRPETIDALSGPATPARQGYDDACFRGPTKFSLGFMKPNQMADFGSPRAFGAPGAGGSMAFADPAVPMAYGYVTDKMGTSLQGDPRDLALRRALADVLRRRSV